MKKTIIIVLTILVTGFFTFLFANCIINYQKFDVEYNELAYRQLTFKEYEKIKKGRGGDFYEIYFKEYEKPFVIDNITKNGLDKEALEKLEKNQVIEIYYCESSSINYEYSICEMKSKSTVLLSLSDCIEVNQTNQMAGMIVCPIMIACCLFLGIIIFRVVNAEGRDTGLGKIRIEYIADGNVIRVYNSINVCSLVINDKIIQQYWGAVSTTFCLKGEIEVEGRKISVEARMGLANMRLYYDGKHVKTKFMGFG